MKDLKTLVYVFGVVAAVLLCAFGGIILMKTMHGAGVTLPAVL